MGELFSKSVRRARLVLASILLILQTTMPLIVFADGNHSPSECKNDTPNVIGSIDGEDNGKTGDLASYNVGLGSIVEGVCIKSGESSFGDKQHSDKITEDGTYGNLNCYTVSGIGTQSITVTRKQEKDCKDISHIDVIKKTLKEIKVSKQVDEGNGVFESYTGSKFTWSVDGESQKYSMGSTQYIASGTHTISENMPDGYELIGWYNTLKASEGCHTGGYTPAVNGSVEVRAANNGVRQITLCNKKVKEELKTGSVKVHKRVDTNGDNVYDGLNVGVSAFKWGLDGATPDRVMGSDGWLKNVSVGDHTVNENSVPDYTFKGWYYKEDKDYSCTNPRGTTLPASIEVKKDTITHVVLCNQKIPTPPVDYCNPSQKPGGMNIYQWLTANNPVPECVKYTVTPKCGSLSVILTENKTPYNYGFSYSIGSVDWNYDTDASNIVFPEDYNGGSVTVYFWATGQEGDYFKALGYPWYQHEYEQITIDTDCQDPPKVDFCDPSQKPATGSIAKWLADNQVNKADCFKHDVAQECGFLNVILTDYPTKNGWGPYSVIYTTDGSVTYPANNFPAQFAEDEGNGSVDVYWYIVGPEGDYLTDSGLPNFWDGTSKKVTVNTDCEEPEEPNNNCIDNKASTFLKVQNQNAIADTNCYINGTKFNDANGSKAFENGEELLSGFEFELYSCTNPVNDIVDDTDCENATFIGAATSQNDGTFSFHITTNSTYMVCERARDGWQQTLPSDNACWLVPVQNKSCDIIFGNKAKDPGEVLGSDPEPKVLANTGSSALMGIVVALSILGAASSVATISSKKN